MATTELKRDLLLYGYLYQQSAFGTEPSEGTEDNAKFITTASDNYVNYFGVSAEKARQGLQPGGFVEKPDEKVLIAYELPVHMSIKLDDETATMCSRFPESMRYVSGGTREPLHLSIAALPIPDDVDSDEFLATIDGVVQTALPQLQPALMSYGLWMANNDTVVYTGLPMEVGGLRGNNRVTNQFDAGLSQFDQGFVNNAKVIASVASTTSSTLVPPPKLAHITGLRFTRSHDEKGYWSAQEMVQSLNDAEDGFEHHVPLARIMVGKFVLDENGFDFPHRTFDIPVPGSD